MAAATVRSALTAAGYTAISTGSASGVCQHMGGGMVRIVVAGSDPGVNATDYLRIGSIGNLPNSFTWSSLGASDNVYARADREDAVVVTAKS